MIGAHYVPGGEFVLPIMDALSKAGRPMPFMTLMRQKWDSELTPSKVKAVSLRTKIVQRWYWENVWHDAPLPNWTVKDNYQAGVTFCNAYLDRLPIDSAQADWHQILNEPNNPPTDIGTASFWKGAMDAAVTRGVRLAIGAWSNTWPALPGEDDNGHLKHDDGFWLRADTIEMVRQCKAQGHIMMTHEYVIPDDPPWNSALWAAGWGMGRYEKVIDLLPADCRDVLWCLGEWGTGIGSTLGGQTMKDCWYAGDIAMHNTKVNLLGAAGWCWGPWNEQGRASSDIGYHRQDALDYWTLARF